MQKEKKKCIESSTEKTAKLPLGAMQARTHWSGIFKLVQEDIFKPRFLSATR